MDFQNNLIQYIFSTIGQYESLLYKKLQNDSSLKLPLSFLKMPQSSLVFVDMIYSLLNNCYTALILKDNDKMIEPFTKIKDSATNVKHDYMCILKLIAKYIKTFYGYIDRKNLDISSHQTYLESFHKEFNKHYIIHMESIEEELNHKCELSEDIEKLEPTKKVFFAFENEQKELEHNLYIAKISSIYEKVLEHKNKNNDNK